MREDLDAQIVRGGGIRPPVLFESIPGPGVPSPLNSILNFLAFQAAWFAAVYGASKGSLLAGPLAFGGVVVLHLVLVPKGRRIPELLFVLSVGILGTGMDAGLQALGLTAYPGTTDAWGGPIPPPWITSLWVGFATLPRFSLAWLGRKPLLWPVVLGGIGGPLSFASGVRIGAVGYGDAGPLLASVGLGLQYALVTPMLLRWAPGLRVRTTEEAPGNQGGSPS